MNTSTTSVSSSRIRPAERRDIEVMQAIERTAGQLFAEIGMEDVSAHDPGSHEELLEYVEGQRAWVAEVDGHVVGYAQADVVDGAGHLEQVSVRPEYGRRGIGRALVEVVSNWARDHGFRALTLLTFCDVPWNGPYYARLGFQPLPDAELTPELRALRAHERELGLDIDARQAMRLDLPLTHRPGQQTASRPSPER